MAVYLELAVGLAYILFGYLLARKSLTVWAAQDNRSRLAYLLFPHSFRNGRVGQFVGDRTICGCWSRRSGQPDRTRCAIYVLINVAGWPVRLGVNLIGYLLDLVRVTVNSAPSMAAARPTETPVEALEANLCRARQELAALEIRRQELAAQIGRTEELLAAAQRPNEAEPQRDPRSGNAPGPADCRYPDGQPPDWLDRNKRP